MAPLISTVPGRGSLVTISIVDVSVKAGLSTGLVEDIADLVAELRGHSVGSLSGGLVREERSDEEVVLAVGEGRGVGAESLDSLHGVALEHEEGVGEGGAWGGGGVLEELVHGCLGLGVVGLEVDGEAGVGVSGLAARSVREGDTGPCCQIAVVAGGVGIDDGSKSLEWCRVGGTDNIGSFLDEVESNDRLAKVSEKSHMLELS